MYCHRPGTALHGIRSGKASFFNWHWQLPLVLRSCLTPLTCNSCALLPSLSTFFFQRASVLVISCCPPSGKKSLSSVFWQLPIFLRSCLASLTSCYTSPAYFLSYHFVVNAAGPLPGNIPFHLYIVSFPLFYAAALLV